MSDITTQREEQIRKLKDKLGLKEPTEEHLQQQEKEHLKVIMQIKQLQAETEYSESLCVQDQNLIISMKESITKENASEFQARYKKAQEMLQYLSHVAIKQWDAEDGRMSLLFHSFETRNAVEIQVCLQLHDNGDFFIQSVTSQNTQINNKITGRKAINNLMGTDSLPALCHEIQVLIDSCN